MSNSFAKKVLLGSTAILFFLLYWHTFSWLANKWAQDPDYSHGFLIPLISGYVIWSKKEKLKQIKVRPSNWGLIVLILGLLLEVISVRANVSFSSAYSSIIVLLGITLYWGGKETLNELLFPILFLLFMVPFFQFLIDPISYKLKLFSTYLSTETVRMAGIPIYREGVIISLPRGALEVADPCSGIRSLMSFLMVGTLFAYFACGSVLKKVALVVITIPLIIFGNSFRVMLAVLLLHFWGIIISNTHWETAIGVIVFMVVVSGLFLTGRLLKCPLSDLTTS